MGFNFSLTYIVFRHGAKHTAHSHDFPPGDCLVCLLLFITKGVTILKILDSVTFSILRSLFDLILDFYIYFF